jgi:hypothetical protein
MHSTGALAGVRQVGLHRDVQLGAGAAITISVDMHRVPGVIGCG